LPKVKRFLKEKNGIDLYEGVSIEWIPHHNPDLIILENGVQLKTIDLSGYTTEALHVLFQKYFKLKGRRLEENVPDSTRSQPILGGRRQLIETPTKPPGAALERNATFGGPTDGPDTTASSLLHEARAPQLGLAERGAAEPAGGETDALGTPWPSTPALSVGACSVGLLAVLLCSAAAIARRRRHRQLKSDLATAATTSPEAEQQGDSAQICHVA